MSYYSYTILECSNPELISSGSTFVQESLYSLRKRLQANGIGMKITMIVFYTHLNVKMGNSEN